MLPEEVLSLPDAFFIKRTILFIRRMTLFMQRITIFINFVPFFMQRMTVFMQRTTLFMQRTTLFMQRMTLFMQRITLFMQRITKKTIQVKPERLMLQFNIKEVLLRKGIKKPQGWLRREIGITAGVAQRLLEGKTQHCTLGIMYKLCARLHLRPDDLLIYVEKPGEALDASHPLQEMRKKVSIKLMDQLETITSSQLARLEAFAAELRKEEASKTPPATKP